MLNEDQLLKDRKNRKRILRTLITKHVNAQIDLSNKGAEMPEFFDDIENSAKEARHRLDSFIERIL